MRVSGYSERVESFLKTRRQRELEGLVERENLKRELGERGRDLDR